MEAFLRSLSDAQMLGFIVVENVVIFLFSILAGEWIVRLFKSRLKCPPRALTSTEIWLSVGCIFNNCVVTVVGFYLWKNDFITIRTSDSWVANVTSFLILFVVMDLAMFVFHRLAHWELIYPYVHKSHHEFTEVRPLTLFALNPIETLGFGALWLSVVWLCSPTWFAVIAYLITNVIFGSLGHLSVEPLPGKWLKIPLLRHLTTTTFHVQHHQDIGQNFGFYTSLWDRIARSLAPNYEAQFIRATESAEEQS